MIIFFEQHVETSERYVLISAFSERKKLSSNLTVFLNKYDELLFQRKKPIPRRGQLGPQPAKFQRPLLRNP